MSNRPNNRFASFTKILLSLSVFSLMAACGGGGAKSPDTTTPPPPTATAQVASLLVQRTAGKIKSDDSDSSKITVTALDKNGGIVNGASIQFSAPTGILSPGLVTTDAQGKGAVDFSSGSTDITTRTATIVASANGVSSQITVLISGSTIDVTSPVSSLPDNGLSTTTLTVTVKDAGGNSPSGIPVTLTQAGGGGIKFSPANGITDSSGQFIATVSGLRPGTATATISAIGETRTQVYTVTPTSTTAFNIDQQTLNGVLIANNDTTPMTIGQLLEIRVNAPGATNVIFASTQGGFGGAIPPSSTLLVPVAGGKATATFTSSAAGIASIQVFDPNTSSVSTDTMTAAITSAVSSAVKIALQATPNIVSVSLGGISSTSSLIATVTDSVGNPVGGAVVAFQIISGTGGGELVSPVIQLTNTTATAGLSLGQAKATFTSGSLPSSQGGVKIRASVVGASTTVQTRDPDPAADPCPLCGVDAAITIGGTAASIAIGQPSDFSDSSDKTQYIFPMSVTVSDASGAGVSGAPVSLSVFPIAWSTSISGLGIPYGCGFDLDDTISRGTFVNEDINEDFILDAVAEDGLRKYYVGGGIATGSKTKDNKITAPPADGGVLPPAVVTNASGIASFTLIYPKSSAFHVIDRIRASTTVQGTETVGELKFRLPALKIDVPSPTECKLAVSPYIF